MIQGEASNETNRDGNGRYLLYGRVARDGANDADNHCRVNVSVEPGNKTNLEFNSKANGEASSQTCRLLGWDGTIAAAGRRGKHTEDWRRGYGNVAVTDL